MIAQRDAGPLRHVPSGHDGLRPANIYRIRHPHRGDAPIVYIRNEGGPMCPPVL